MPTYNRVDSLLKVIDAIAAQTYPPAEIFIADDGSTDDTSTIVQGRGIQNLRVIKLAHSGLPATARNAGLNQATGDWIAFCDSDDVWAPNRLETQISQKFPGTKAMCSNAWVKPGNASSYRMFEDFPKRISVESLLNRNWVVNSSVLIKKELLDEVGGVASSPNLKGVEDYATWLRVSSISSFQPISEPLVTYCDDRQDSLRGQQKFEVVLNQAYAWVDFLAWMRSRGQPLTASETAISAGLPKLIATNLKLSKKPQR